MDEARLAQAGSRSRCVIQVGTTILSVGPGGSNPLAPTTYEYSKLRRERRTEAVADGMFAEVHGRLAHAEHLDALKDG